MISPEPPIEAKATSKNAPNEPNLHDQESTSERPVGLKDVRIDAQRFDHKPRGIGVASKITGHSVLEGVLDVRKSTLMNLEPIFGDR